MNEPTRFNQYTKQLRDVFPTWSKIRKDEKSIGAQFLSVIGWQLGDVERILQYADEQYHIGTADINQADVIYKARIPNSLRPDVNYRFSSGSHILYQVDTIEDFLASPEIAKHNPAIQYDTKFYIDFTLKYIYVNLPLEANDTYPDGYLTLTLISEAGKETWSEPIPLMVHHVWNFFDEFGLLLDTPRLHGEKNALYKERILDVFRRPSSSTYTGLINGIARDLGLVHEVVWQDGGQAITLLHNRINLDSITIDDESIIADELTKDTSGRIILLGNESYNGLTRMVRYIAGVTVHELHDTEDLIFQSELYHPDGTATDLLQYYANTIRNYVPIMWGQWKWNQGFWDASDESMTGYGFIPVLYDGDFSGWKNYVSKEG